MRAGHLVFIGNTLTTSGGPGDTPTGEQARAELRASGMPTRS
jgi:hypothetical protein